MTRLIILNALVALVIAIAVNAFWPENGHDESNTRTGSATRISARDTESAYDRVMRTKTIRCGYINYPPHNIIDPNTGKISGIMHDIMEEAARVLDLKIEWTEELGWATTVTALESGRVDAICTSFWQNPVEGRHVNFSIPLFYSGVGAYVRENSAITSLDQIDENATIAVSDSNGSDFIAKQDFPRSKLYSLSNMADESELLVAVNMGKADVAFIETYIGLKFIAGHPGSLRNLVPDHPVRLFGNTIALPQNDARMKIMLDSALVQLLHGGFVEKTLRKYEEVTGGLYRVAPPFKAL